MTANKIGAVVLAAALIVGAVFLRQAITGDDNGGGATDPSSPTDTRAPGSGKYQLICSTEFADICNALDNDDVEVTIQAAGQTLQSLASVDPTELPDAWLTLDPFPAMLAETRQRPAGLPTPLETTVLASTEPMIAVKPDLEDGVSTLCSGTSLWACLGAQAGQSWSSLDVDFGGNVAMGLPDPANEALGLVQFATALAGFFPAAALDDQPWTVATLEFTSWLRAMKSTNTSFSSQTPLDVLAVRPLINVAATTSAEVGEASTSAFATFSVEPSIDVNAVFATFDSANDSLQSELADALSEASWDSPPGTPLAASATTFIAIRNLWRQ